MTRCSGGRTCAASGSQSRGKGQVRGNGWLVLTDDELRFKQWVPAREDRIPLSGGHRGGNAACVARQDVAGSCSASAGGPPTAGDDAMAWEVRDLDAWLSLYNDWIVPGNQSGEAVPAFVVVALAPPAFRPHTSPGREHTMATGTVKWFSDEKGFGFITPDDEGKDLFVHHTGIAGSGFKSLPEGAKVSYDAENGPKGPNAANVQTI